MSTLIQLPSGGSVPREKTIYVTTNGNDSTGLRNDASRPFLTIGAAITASLAGDVIIVAPGDYPETGLVLNDLSLVSSGGWQVTSIGPATGGTTRITVGDLGYVQGFTVNCMTASPDYALEFNQASGTNSIYDMNLVGNGGGMTQGQGLRRSGGGKTIGANIRVELGGIKEVFTVESGVLALEGIHVPQSTGSINNVLLVTTDNPMGPTVAGRAQMIGFNVGNSNVVNAINSVQGVSGIIPTVKMFTANIFNVGTVYKGSGRYESLEILGGAFENIQNFVVDLDLAGNAVETKYRITANHQPVYRYSPTNAAFSDFSLNFTQETTDVFDSSYNVFGAEQISMGFTERGTKFSTGRGAPYTTGMVVLNTDNTAGDGGNIQDITEQATSKSGSTFGFQGNLAGHKLYFGSQRVDFTGTPFVFYGIELFTDTAMIGGEIQFEAWNGGSWLPITAMNTENSVGYSYGNAFFLRSGTDELIRFGITDDSNFWSPASNYQITNETFSAKTINGVLAYWIRAVIVSAPTTLPSFERSKLLDSSFSISSKGLPSSTGLSMFRKNISLNGKIWSSSGGGQAALDDYTRTVGNSSNINSFTLALDGSQFAANAVASGQNLNVSFPLPIGICTAYPISLKLIYESTNGPADLIGSNSIIVRTRVLPQEVSGTLVANTSGVLPSPRRINDTDLLSAAGSRDTLTALTRLEPSGYTGTTTWADVDNQLHEQLLTNVDVSSIYENDMILFNLEIQSKPASGEIVVYSLIVEGVSHQDGKSLV